MLVRAIILSLALLLGIGTLVPLATNYAEAGSKKVRKYKKKKRSWRGVKKYSKRWWQLYRAQERRKKRRAAQRRSLRLRQMRLAKAREAATGDQNVAQTVTPTAKTRKAAVLPSGEKAPQNWQASNSTPGEMTFKVDNPYGMEVGSASISVVGPATGETSMRSRNKVLGGVATTSLRREVINKMIQENGWVVNDYQQEIGGRQVYVVSAQSQQKNGRVQARMFYFTEVNGRIYSVATNADESAAERLAAESEKVIHSLQGTASRRVQQAAKE